MAMLEVKNLSISFGGLKAVNGFNITIEKNRLYGLIGPNGAVSYTHLDVYKRQLLYYSSLRKAAYLCYFCK